MSTTRSTFSTSDVQTLNHDHVQKLLAWAEGNPSFRDVVHAMKIILETGLRKGELCDLRWIDADFSNSHFRVNGNKQEYPRVVPFGPTTMQVLQERQDLNPASTFIFGEGKGKLDRIARQFSSLASLVGLDRLTLHALRHTFFSRLMDSGAPMSLIVAIGGWSSRCASIMSVMHHSEVETTRAYYSALGKRNGGKQ